MLLDPDARKDERLVVAERLEHMGIEVAKSHYRNHNDTSVRSQAFFDAGMILRGLTLHDCTRNTCGQKEFHQ